MPAALSQFLAWYLSPFTRMARGRFNIIFFIALLPPLLLKVSSFQEDLGVMANSGQNSMQMMQSMLQSNAGIGYDDTTDDIDAIRNIQQQRLNMNSLVQDTLMGGNKAPKAKAASKTPWSDILSFIIFIAMIPLVQMRLRDIGKNDETELWVFTGLIYTAVVFDGLKSIVGISIPSVIGITATILSFVVLSWVCIKKPAVYIPPSERVPGDKNTFDPHAKSPDDPY